MTVAGAIAVVIPTYNRLSLVRRAVTSVLAGGAPGTQVLVVDDGSTDGTIDQLTAMGDDRLRVLSQDHAGAGAARNYGASLAETPWLLFLDSDDEMLPGGLALLESQLSNGVGLASGEALRRTSKGIVSRATAWDLSYVAPGARAVLNSGTYVADRQTFMMVGGFDTGLPSGQHTDLGFRLIPELVRRGRSIVHVTEPVAIHNIGSPHSIRKDQWAVLEGTERLINRHVDMLRTSPRVLADYHGVAGVAAGRCEEPRRARRHFRAAVLAEPTSLKRWGRLGVSLLPFGSRVWR